MTYEFSRRRRGGPLLMLGLVVGVWVTGRAAMWENPFPLQGLDGPIADLLLAEADASRLAPEQQSPRSEQGLRGTMALVANPSLSSEALAQMVLSPEPLDADPEPMTQAVAAGHQLLMAAAFAIDWSPAPQEAALAEPQAPVDPVVSPVAPPLSLPLAKTDRWSLDVFGFYRGGAGSASLGRVPVYGASQAGANLQYRIAPASVHDPRAYARAYRAFIDDGENEIAAGLSARPIGGVPVRVAAELRVTDNAFGTDIRPAAYAITELPPIALPFSVDLEAYGGAGYVGGDAATPFVDGQASLTRKLAEFQASDASRVKLSLGGGVWGGAQEGAGRLDVGPTVRIDLAVGDVPARVSVDWREKVAGDADPDSGVAATLSTRF